VVIKVFHSGGKHGEIQRFSLRLTRLMVACGWFAILLLPALCLAADSIASTSDWSHHLAQVRKTVPAGFTVVEQPPFVVIGDAEPDMVRTYSQQVVKWTVDRIKQDLCYYLQEHGLLVNFYREFNAHSREDPTGYATLQRVLSETDMTAFQKKWEKFVLALPPP
jgi:hypothetical protein